MGNYSTEEIENALLMVSSLIRRCEKQQPKFAVGTSQYTLLQNRIKALYISKSFLQGEKITGTYTKEDLAKALPPIISIISKCEKAQLNCTEGTAQYKRFTKIIEAMTISKSLIEEEISER
ncbi:hypothetical protein IZU99_03620 [Oscillospiraceae bacterium CM]|nr:hypothetical protein IZU99_03620 [Oscillospiraceae bacterium CM]